MNQRKQRPDPSTVPLMDDIGRKLQRIDALGLRLYRRYPELFQGIEIPADMLGDGDTSHGAARREAEASARERRAS